MVKIELGNPVSNDSVYFLFDAAKIGLAGEVKLYKERSGDTKDERLATITIAEIRCLARALGV